MSALVEEEERAENVVLRVLLVGAAMGAGGEGGGGEGEARRLVGMIGEVGTSVVEGKEREAVHLSRRVSVSFLGGSELRNSRASEELPGSA